MTTVLLTDLGGVVVQGIFWAVQTQWVSDLNVPSYTTSMILIFAVRFITFVLFVFLLDPSPEALDHKQNEKSDG